MKLTNREIFALAKDDQTYKSFTSELTNEIFTQAGYEAIANNDIKLLADFFGLSIRVVLQKIKTPKPRIPGLYKKVVEEYKNEEGGIFQRINTKLLKPTSPKYRNLVNGGSVDPFKIRKPESDERFFRQNFDFQNFLTIQDIELKKMFLSETGISDYVTGLLKSLDDSYAIQKYETFREMIHFAITSSKAPLQPSQIITTPLIDEDSSNQDMAKFIQVFHNVNGLMTNSVYSGKFNAKKFEHGLYPEDYVLMVRADILDILKTTIMATTYHTENLGIPFKIEGVKDFGGLIYKSLEDEILKPVYDDFGTCIGFNKTGEGEPLEDDKIKVVDPHANIDAILMQKGTIFASEQQTYTTKTIYNPAGEYTNFWASQPNGAFNYDACYDIIVFSHNSINAKKEKK